MKQRSLQSNAKKNIMPKRLRYWFISLWLFSFSSMTFANSMVYMKNIRVQSSKEMTRIQFVLTQKTHGKVTSFFHPNRLFVEFANTKQLFHFSETLPQTSIVRSISIEQDRNNVLRFILLTKDKARWSVRFLPNKISQQTILEMDILYDKKAVHPSSVTLKNTQKYFAAKTHTVVNPTSKKAKAFFTPEAIEKLATQSIFTIVIDPGHGGKDSGALGQHGEEEKTIVLNIAKRLVKELNQQSHVHAVLTRDGDYYLKLRERLKLARKAGADLFISIHADAYFNNQAHGASVYALSPRGATSEAARWLAQRENYSEVDGVEFDSLQDRSLMLRKVLIDLAQTTTTEDSVQLGNQVLDALDDVSALHHKFVEQAPFVVLKSPDIPSILVETGFISNSHEAKHLMDSAYQAQLSQALRRGIVQFMNKYQAINYVAQRKSLSSTPIHSIVRHELLTADSHDTTHSKTDALVGKPNRRG